MEDKKVRSSLQEELKSVIKEANQKRDERREQLQEEVDSKITSLAAMDEYSGLTTKQKKDFVYNVKPHFNSIAEMLSKGATQVQIARTLGISYRSLKTMRENIPELDELFYIADMEMIEMAEASMRYLAQPRVIEKQELDRYGNVVTLQEFKEPQMQAAKFILERRDDRYSDRRVIEHQATVSDELQQVLESMSLRELEELDRQATRRDEAIDAEVTDVRES